MDLFPSQEQDILPDMEVAQEYSPATASYLAKLSKATNEIYKSIAIPATDEEWKARMATKDGEMRMREAFSYDAEQLEASVREEVAREAILNGASAEEVTSILNHGREQPLSTSVIEKGAAKFLVDQGLASPERAAAMVIEEFVEGRDDTNQREDFAATMFRLNVIRHKLADRWKEKGFSDKALDFLAMAFVPGHTTATNAKMFGRDIERQGTSIEKFQDNFWSAPFNERMAILDNFEANLENNTAFSENTLAALEQIENLISFKPEQKLELDIIEGLDATAIASAPFGIIRAYRAISSAARLLGSKDVSVARAVQLKQELRTDMDELELGRFADDGGPVPEGDPVSRQFTPSPDFEARQTDDYGRWADDGGRVIDEDELIDNLVPSMATTDNIVEKAVGPANKAVEQVDLNRAYEQVLPTVLKQLKERGINLPEEATPSELLMAYKGLVTPEILRAEEQLEANRAAMIAILRQFKLDNHAARIAEVDLAKLDSMLGKSVPMFDVEVDEFSGLRTVTAYLGTGRDRLKGYVSEAAAHRGAKRLGLQDGFYEISNRSGEYFIKVTRTPGTTQFIKLIDDANIPRSFIPFGLGKYIKGAKTTQDEDAIQGAALAVKAHSVLARQVTEAVSKIQKLGPDSRKTYDNLMLEIQQDEKWKTLEEFREWYSANYQRQPTQKEHDAYIATRQLHSFDYVVRNANVQKELAALGYQEVSVRGLPGFPTIGKVVETTSVDPRSTRIYDATRGEFADINSRQELAELLAEGDNVLVKTLQEHRAYGQYVIAPRTDVNIKALRAQVLNWLDGPHRIYDGDHFVKQQKIGYHNGRETIFNPRTHFVLKGGSEARRVAEEYNEALRAYAAAAASDDPLEKAKASEVISRNTYFSSWDEFHKAVADGDIELTPFEVTKHGELPTYRADELAGSRAIDPDFANLSDELQAMIEQGRMFYSTRGPRLRHPKDGLAPLLHPNEIMTRAINNVVNTAAYTNYKIRQVNRWVNTYGKYMVGYDPNRPAIETFMHGVWDNSPSAKRQIKFSIQDKAEGQRMAIKRFLRATGTIEQEASKYRNHLIDVIDDKANAKWADRFADITSNNPIAFARGVAFRAYLGGDPSQLIVQMAVMPGVAAVAPMEATKAALSWPFIRAALLNPKHSGFMGQLAAKMADSTNIGAVLEKTKAWDKKQFVELIEDIRKTGVDVIDANLGDLDSMNNKSWMKGRLGYYGAKLDKAWMTVYNEAEKANSVIGFTIAWLEHYNKYGRRPSTVEELAAVRVRGDAFSGNMSRDGKAYWQEGLTSLPAQFAGHPARVTELLLTQTPGGFTPKEKFRYYAGLALAYGPFLGIAGQQWLAEQYRDMFGEYPNEEWLTLASRGLIGMLFPETDISRLQPYAQETLLSDLFKDDGGIGFEEFMGPSGQLGSNFVEAMIGRRKLWALMSGQVGFDLAPLALRDVANDVFKTIASYNRAERAITAWQHKMLYSRSGQILQKDLDEFDAIMIGLGFPPIESKEAFEASAMFKEYKKKVFKDATIAASYLRKAIEYPEGSEQSRLNYAYFHSIARLHKYGDISGDGGDLFRREVDKLMKQQGAYNEQTWLRIYRELNKQPPGLVRNNGK